MSATPSAARPIAMARPPGRPWYNPADLARRRVWTGSTVVHSTTSV